jgi:HSP20 family protein
MMEVNIMMYRRLRTPTVWHEMGRLQHEMNRMFDAYAPQRMRVAPSFPAMNVWSNEEGLLVTAEVPGVDPKEIQVNVVNDTLTLSGERLPEQTAESACCHRQERGYGKFTRSLQLPYSVNTSKVEASFKNGVLQIRLPRKEEDKPKKIQIKVA